MQQTPERDETIDCMTLTALSIEREHELDERLLLIELHGIHGHKFLRVCVSVRAQRAPPTRTTVLCVAFSHLLKICCSVFIRRLRMNMLKWCFSVQATTSDVKRVPTTVFCDWRCHGQLVARASPTMTSARNFGYA